MHFVLGGYVPSNTHCCALPCWKEHAVIQKKVIKLRQGPANAGSDIDFIIGSITNQLQIKLRTSEGRFQVQQDVIGASRRCTTILVASTVTARVQSRLSSQGYINGARLRQVYLVFGILAF